MKRRSDIAAPAVFALLLVFSSFATAQEGGWTVSLSGGFNAPSLTTVNETLDRTVRDWNTLQQIPISSLGHFSAGPTVAFRGSYRFERDVAVNLSGSYWEQTLASSYNDAESYLSLKRSARTMDFMVGLSYYLEPLVADMEVSIVVDAGLMFAYAHAVSYNTREEKIGGVSVTTVFYDSDAIYRKAKLTATAGAIWTWSTFSPVFIKAEALYRFANMGKMDGEIRRLTGTFEEQTTTEFDFSGLTATVGIGILF